MGRLQGPDKWSGFSGMVSSAHWPSSLFLEVRMNFGDQWGDDKVLINVQDLPGWFQPPLGLQICFLKHVENLNTNGRTTRSRQMAEICRDGVIFLLAFEFFS